jgi:trigger factor
MSVVVSLEDIGACRKQLKVEVPAPAVEAETQRVMSELGHKMRIPGFRPGKVPAKVMRQRYAKEIERQVVERLVPRYWRQAQAEASIEPLLPPEVHDVKELLPGEPLTFVATVETRPQIELGDIAAFDLPNPSTDPGTVEIEDMMESLRKQLSKWVAVERPAARGDLVEAQITQIAGAHMDASGAHPPRTEGLSIEVGDPNVWEELSLAVSGLTAGQEATFTRSHEHEPAHEGGEKEVHQQTFKLTVDAVKERDLPPLDDDFAQQVNPQLTTLEQLRDMVTERLRQNKAEQRHETRQRALLDQLRERYPLDLPQGVVRQEVEGLVQEYADSLARQGMDVEKAGIDWSRMAEDMAPLAERRVHGRLLLDAVADAESVHVGEEEFERALALLARAQNTSTPALRRLLDEEGRLSGFRSQLRRDKTIRRLLGEEAAASAPVTALEA